MFAGPIAGLIFFVCLPENYTAANGQAAEFSRAGRVTLAVMAWMAIWWLTEAVELSTTALLPIALFPLFGAMSATDAAAPYAHRLIFLFLGGFIIALSMQRWGLDKRIALGVLKMVGAKPANMVGGFMLSTAGLSAFISNTATTAMMLPIALSVVTLLKEKAGNEAGGENFSVCLMLGIAYAASIGGMCTLIGTPPNAFLAAFLRDSIAEPYRMEIDFARWLMFGLPVTLTMLPITWWMLTRWLFPIRVKEIKGGRELIGSEIKALGKIKRGERITLIVFLLAAFCWIARPLLLKITIPLGGSSIAPFAGLSDPVIAVIAAVLLFAIPVNVAKREFTMNWDTASKLPWDILILFGGGMSLAAAVKANGVAEFIGSQAGRFAGMPSLLLILIVVTSVIFLTELTSNLATTATLLPVLAALAPPLGVHPYMLVFTATIAASCAFMMPVATPPNAIVFGSRLVTLPQMVKAGWWLNLIGIVVVTTLASVLIEVVTGIKMK